MGCASPCAAGAREQTAGVITEKHDIETVVTDGCDTIATANMAGARELTAHALRYKQDLETVVMEASATFASATEAGARELTAHTLRGKKDIETVVMDASDTIASATEAGARELTSFTMRGKQDLETVVMNAFDTIASATEAGARELTEHTMRGKQDLETVVMDAGDTIASATEAGARELTTHTTRGKQDIEATIDKGKEDIRKEVIRHITGIQPQRHDEEYLLHCYDDLKRRLIEHVLQNNHSMPLSPLMPNRDARLVKFYVPSKIVRVSYDLDKAKDIGEQITTYQELFNDLTNQSASLYLQGEPGSGKSTFVLKLIIDWCVAQGGEMKNVSGRIFGDLESLKCFDFAFYIKLRNKKDTTNIVYMIKTIIKCLSGYSNKGDQYLESFITNLLETKRCLIVLDGLDEWLSSDAESSVPKICFVNKSTILTTTRHWKLAKTRIPDSEICGLFEIQGVTDERHHIDLVLNCLQKTESDNSDAINIFLVASHNIPLYKSLPIVQMALICIWYERKELQGSLCNIYAHMLEMMCKNLSNPKEYMQDRSKSVVDFPCFLKCRNIKTFEETIYSLSKLAFMQSFAYSRENSVVFDIDAVEKCLSDSQEKLALQWGILTEEKIESLTQLLCNFSFWHKTIQEFLACLYAAKHDDCLRM